MYSLSSLIRGRSTRHIDGRILTEVNVLDGFRNEHLRVLPKAVILLVRPRLTQISAQGESWSCREDCHRGGNTLAGRAVGATGDCVLLVGGAQDSRRAPYDGLAAGVAESGTGVISGAGDSREHAPCALVERPITEYHPRY